MAPESKPGDVDVGELPGTEPGEDNSLSARDAAQAVLQWAKNNHLFARGQMEEIAEAVEEEPIAIEESAQGLFSSQKAMDVFRRRAINMVGFSERERKVVIFTRGRISAAEKKIIPFHVPGGLTVEYGYGGVPQVKGNPPPPQANYPYFEHNGRYCCGSSVFPANCIGAGTLGLLATGADGKLYGVSNNHVAGACNHAQPGLPILAPGPLDVASEHVDPFTIGRHARLLPINDGIPENVDISVNWDACCFELVDAGRVTSMQGNVFDTPPVVADPEPGMFVQKVGRTTGHTTGKIVAQSASPVPVSYVVNEYGVRKAVFFQEVFVIIGANGPFSSRGDSGALVVTAGSAQAPQALGLVFAGDDKGLSFMLPLTPILTKLELTVLSDHNV